MNAIIKTPTVDMLKDVRLMSEFSESELSEILSLGELTNYEPHSNIMIEGDHSGGMFLLLDGTVGVTKSNTMNGIEYDLGILQSGSIFGELSLIDNNPRSATIRALTECSVFHVPREKFDSFLNQDSTRRSRFYHACVQTLIVRLRETDSKYVVSQYQLWKTALSPRKEAA